MTTAPKPEARPIERFALSLVASRPHRTLPGRTETRHTCVIVEAVSVLEAVGVGHRIARKVYPAESDFYGHDVVGQSVRDVRTLENIALDPPLPD